MNAQVTGENGQSNEFIDLYDQLEKLDDDKYLSINQRLLRFALRKKFVEEYKDKFDTFTVAVFGECGQGKSTLLTELAKVYNEQYNKGEKTELVFDASPNLMSVTAYVKTAKSGNMTLINCPGFNDTNKARTDKTIFSNLINTIRDPLKSPNQGITMFLQCIMLD